MPVPSNRLGQRFWWRWPCYQLSGNAYSSFHFIFHYPNIPQYHPLGITTIELFLKHLIEPIIVISILFSVISAVDITVIPIIVDINCPLLNQQSDPFTAGRVSALDRSVGILQFLYLGLSREERKIIPTRSLCNVFPYARLTPSK